MKLVIRSVFTLLILALSFTAVAQTPAPAPPLGSTPVPTAASTQPLPNTIVSTGMVTNYGSPYNVGPYVSGLALINTATSQFPTYGGFHYEFYRNTATGAASPIAYAGMATIKTVFYHKESSTFIGRVSLFADISLGGAGSVQTISSAFQGGGGVALQLGKYSVTNTPHWELVVEPMARRVPALANGTNAALLIGAIYSFNRPQ